MTLRTDNQGSMPGYTGYPRTPQAAAEGFLSSPAGSLLEVHSGDLCSLLGVTGASMLLLSRRVPALEQAGQYSVMGSVAAGGVDTAIQGSNMIGDRAVEARKRGRESTVGSMAYAATGLIPAASLRTIQLIKKHPVGSDRFKVGLLGLNAGVLGYELIHRVPRIAVGDEDLSGYGSLAASAGGFVVARHAFQAPHPIERIAKIARAIKR